MTVAMVLMALACAAAAAAALELASAVPALRDGGRRATATTRDGAVAARWAADRTRDEQAELLLDAAGRTAVPTVAVLRARERTAALVVAAWSAAVLFALAGPVLAALVAPAAGLVARRAPHALLRRAARVRAERLRDEAPEVIALVAAGAACGLPLAALLSTAGEWLDGELARALRLAGRDLQRGAAPERVLETLEREQPVDDVRALLAILRRGREHGVAPAPALRALATASRSARARRAADRAARAAPRIQLVAALLLVPAALCMLAAAMLSGGLGG